jgi:hypothetical protein
MHCRRGAPVSPAALLAALRRHGFEVRADGGGLVCRGPVAKLTPKLRGNLAEHKPGLLRLLAVETRARANPLVLAALRTFEGAALCEVRLPATSERWRTTGHSAGEV